MRKISVGLITLMWICISCEKKTDPQYSGEFVLSSELILADPSWSFYGFTFEDGQIKLYPAGSSVLPDISVTYNDFNQVVSLESSNQEDAFHKNGDFTNAGAAEGFFNSYSEVITNNYKAQADTVEVNQVWTVQTVSKKFAKLWINDSQLNTGAHSDYVEITIKYQYQPDGSKTFPN